MTFLSALILGLVASAHCSGMCGGLQMAMQPRGERTATLRSRHEALVHLLLMNVGRIVTYVLAGIIFSSVGYAALNGLAVPTSTRWLRVITGVVVFIIGVQILLGKGRLFQFVEPIGAAIWRPVSKLINHASNLKRQSLITGIAWGFLPCGLVYSVLFLSVLSHDLYASASIMLGFGLGTMPSLVLTGLLYKKFSEAVSQRSFQRVGGAFFILGGTLIVSAPYWVNKEFLNDYPALLNLAFCIS